MAHEDFQVSGSNSNALFTLKLHRGDGMTLIAMDWKNGKPPLNFVGFAIEYQEPGGSQFFSLKNRISFPGANLKGANALSTRLSPIQMFRWVHFPRNAEMDGLFTYRVTPVFMNSKRELSYGEFQEAQIALRRETYPGKLNVTFTRGFVSSQAFVDYYGKDSIPTLLPSKSHLGLTFKPTHPKREQAYKWMGFEARDAILEVLDLAIKDPKAAVKVVAYDLSEIEVVTRLKKLGKRLQIIIDDSPEHKKAGSAENQAEVILTKSAGKANVKRQHLGKLQHNKTIVVDAPTLKAAVCGSTNFTWRGLYVQNNNALIVYGAKAIAPFKQAFDDYWNNGTVAKFGASKSAKWVDLGFPDIKAKVTFSPHAVANQQLARIAKDLEATKSSLFFSLAFLYQTPGPIVNTIKKIQKDKSLFCYGISDKPVGGFDLTKSSGSTVVVYPEALKKGMPAPFREEPVGGGGTRLHHKFLVVDFDKPSARVYLGSYNFSNAADTANGENLVLIQDQRIATSYMIEALRIFDHYNFRARTAGKKTGKKGKAKIELKLAPEKAGETAWWQPFFTDARKIKDRKLFA
ncbi:MAG: phospholipase D-like domain-containing protein [Cyclobacteriaceae bacterium]|jgi:hypothetical protein